METCLPRPNLPKKPSFQKSSNHPEWGPLKFVSSPLQVSTPLGDLTLYAYHALGLETAQLCLEKVKKVGTEAIPLAPWPHPSFFEETSLV